MQPQARCVVGVVGFGQFVCLYIERSPLTMPKHLWGTFKHVDYLVGVPGTGTVAFDVKDKSVYQDALMSSVSVEIQEGLTRLSSCLTLSIMLKPKLYIKVASAEFADCRIERIFIKARWAEAIRLSDWRGGRFNRRALAMPEDELLVLLGDAIVGRVLPQLYDGVARDPRRSERVAIWLAESRRS